MTRILRPRSFRGFTRVEGTVLLALIGIVALFAVTSLRTISRRERLLRNVRDVQSLLASARSEAVNRNQQVVVLFDLKSRRILTWADELPNFVQDAAEPTIREYRIPSDLFLRYAPGGEAVDGPGAVSFDGYVGDPSLVDRVVFRGDGALVAPGEPQCRPPRAPRRFFLSVPAGSIDCNPDNRCRGIYLSDSAGAGSDVQNSFRVSVDDPGQPRAVTILKWLPEGGNPGETDYVPPPWSWKD